MALQVLLLVAFQILEGFVYRELALIITVFMGGIALGTALAGKWARAEWTAEGGSQPVCARPASRRTADAAAVGRDVTLKLPKVAPFIAVQVVFASIFLVVMGILHVLHQGMGGEGFAPILVSGVFAVLALVSGMLGGIHFAMAVAAVKEIDQGDGSSSGGPGLYALDLLGAAAGALLVTLYLLPIHGIDETLGILALTTLAGALSLLRFR